MLGQCVIHPYYSLDSINSHFGYLLDFPNFQTESEAKSYNYPVGCLHGIKLGPLNVGDSCVFHSLCGMPGSGARIYSWFMDFLEFIPVGGGCLFIFQQPKHEIITQKLY